MTDSGVGAVSRPDTIAPHSAEAEEAVLGSILINPDAIFEVATFLQASDFFIVRNAWIYEAINAVHDRGEAIDNLTVIQELRNRGQLESVGGSAYIAYLMNNTPTHIHAETYGHIVERAAIRRRLLTAASEIAQTALEENAEINEVIDRVESTLFSVTERRLRKDLIPVRQAVSEYFNRIEYLYTHQDEPLGLPTGFIDLDKLLGGLQRSDLCIVAARPGVGKTSFMLSIALNAARARPSKPTTIAIFSMEMSTEQLIQRFIAAETSINSQKLRLGNLDEREWGLFVEATGKLSNLRLFLDDTPAVSVPQIRTKCRRLYREHGLDLIIVDYLQLMSAGIGRNENRVQEISYISRGLKELARELNVPLLSAAQLSRAVEQRQDKRPQLSDLRESGCLAGDTLIYWPERGCYIPIRKLVGQAGFCVSSLNTDTWKLETAEVTNAFCTGVKPVFRLTTQLGRSIRATANHKFLTFDGWKRLDELTENDFVAVPNGEQLVLGRTSPPAPLRKQRGEKVLDTVLIGSPSPNSERGSGGEVNSVARIVSVRLVEAEPTARLAESDVYWDKIVSIGPDGETDVYDLTVPGLSNFVANNIIVHNSIEQDADVVMFIYRDDLYNENSDRPNQADILVSKHRNGPTGVITLYFKKEITQFTNMQKSNINLAEGY
jgi:replicative DNA helicase